MSADNLVTAPEAVWKKVMDWSNGIFHGLLNSIIIKYSVHKKAWQTKLFVKANT